MRKRILVVMAMMATVATFAQKKELRAVDKALTAGNTAEAKNTLESIASLIPNADTKYKAQFYLLKAKTYLEMAKKGLDSNTSFDTAIMALNELDAFKDDSSSKKFMEEVPGIRQGLSAALVNAAVDNNKSKDYKSAATQLYMAYNLDKTNQDYLYYAASSAVNGQNYDDALTYYEELKAIGYEGIQTKYLLTEVATGKDVEVGETEFNIYKKSPDYKNARTEKTESKRAEIVKNIALIYSQRGDTEKAVAAIQEARAANPEDLNLLITEANLYIKLGETDKFKELMEEAIQRDPNNAVLYFNLGVITADSGETDKAKEYYKKSIELDPTYRSSYMNMAALILSEEGDIVDEMNNLGTSSADNVRYDQLKEKREDLYKESIPYLEKVLELKGDDAAAVKTLMNIYSTIGEDAKFKEMKAKLETIEQK